MWDKILDFLQKSYPRFIEGYLIFILIFAIVFFARKSRKFLHLTLVYVTILLIYFITIALNYVVASVIYKYLVYAFPILIGVILAPDAVRHLQFKQKQEKGTMLMSASMRSRNEIADACIYLAERKIGALITIEKHNSLDQYASKAIQLDSDISKELLINIFTPLTPLHDGAVIIRGNKIRCAGAYYVLTQADKLDKTTGSRHRAGIGISEVSDSLTIICSEEKGEISLATEGFLIKIGHNREKLMEYLELFLK